MRLILSIAVALAGCTCQPTSSPTTPLSDQAVYNELVEAGCMAADRDGGLAAVAAEHASPNPAYLNCLYNGGTIAGCAVPCTKPTAP